MKKLIGTQKVAPMSTFNAEITPVNGNIKYIIEPLKLVGKIELPAQKVKKVAPVMPVVAPIAPVKRKNTFNLDVALKEAKNASEAQKALLSYWNIEKFQFHTDETDIIAKMRQFWQYYTPNNKLTGVFATLKAHAISTPFASLV
jgi:hypothetical protein